MGECIECQRNTHCTYEVCDSCMTTIKGLQAKLKVAEEAITNNHNWSWYKWSTKDE